MGKARLFFSQSLIALLLGSALLIQGCGLGVFAAGVGYAVSSSKSSDADIAKAEADLQKAYNEYKLGMERINLDREKSGLKLQPIMSRQEWLDQQALPEKVRRDLAEKKMLKPATPETSEQATPGL